MPGQPAELLVADHLETHLQLQCRQDRDEVGVTTALAVAVDGPLDEPRPGAHRRQGVGDPALRVVVGVDADLDPRAELLVDRSGHRTDPLWKAAAVGVAERHVLGAAVDRRRQALERVSGVVRVAVEEVLGVVDHPLAAFSAEGNRLGDHRQVLLARDARHLVEVERPRLADQGDRGDRALGQDPQRLVLGGGDAAAAGHAEAADGRRLQPLGGEQVEELRLLGVGGGKARLDEVHPQPVQGADDPQLLAGRERHAGPLHAVTQGGVVELQLLHRMPFVLRGVEREAFRPSGAAQARAAGDRPRSGRARRP